MGERRGGRWRRNCGCLLVVLVLLPVLVWLAALHSANRRVDRLMEELKRRGEPTTLAELAPKVPEGEENAADSYAQATSTVLLPPGMDTITGVQSSQWSVADWKTARTFVRDNGEYFRLLTHAAHVKHVAFAVDWNAGVAMNTSPIARLREAVRHLAIKAELEAAQGRIDDALRSSATAIEVARAPAQEPVLIGVLVASAIRAIGTTEMARVLDRGLPSARTCRALYRELDDPDWSQSWVQAVKGERTTLASYSQLLLQQYAAAPGYSRNALRQHAIVTFGRPLVRRQNADNVEYLTQEAEILTLPWPQAKPKQDALVARAGHRPSYMKLFEDLGYPLEGYSHLLWSRDRGAANLGLTRIGLALKAYRADHGVYPDTLAALTDWRLPLDPFSLKPFLYRRQGAGFTVWSVGPDMVDNHAVAYDFKRFKLDTPGYDFVLKCTR
jgi:hypothetical protein